MLRVKTVGAGVDETNAASFFLTPNNANSGNTTKLKLVEVKVLQSRTVTEKTAVCVVRDHIIRELVRALPERKLQRRRLTATEKFRLLKGCGKIHHHTAFMLLCTAVQLNVTDLEMI